MKKRSISIILGIMMMFTFIIACTGCAPSEKPSITADTFVSIMEGKGYEIVDAMDQFQNQESLNDVYVAISPDKDYQLEFYDFVDMDASTLFFNQIKQIFENSKGNSSMNSSVALGNHAKYTLTTNGKYKVVSRINDTAVYIDADEECKDAIAEVLKEIGY